MKFSVSIAWYLQWNLVKYENIWLEKFCASIDLADRNYVRGDRPTLDPAGGHDQQGDRTLGSPGMALSCSAHLLLPYRPTVLGHAGHQKTVRHQTIFMRRRSQMGTEPTNCMVSQPMQLKTYNSLLSEKQSCGWMPYRSFWRSVKFTRANAGALVGRSCALTISSTSNLPAVFYLSLVLRET